MVATKLTTVEELELMPAADKSFELIDGELFEMSPAGTTHSIVTARLNKSLSRYTDNNVGMQVWISDSGFILRRNPDTVLVPDISLLTDEQVDSLTFGSEGFTELAPAIAIEVKSPSNRESEIAGKVSIYLAAGVTEVWWVRPHEKQVWVHCQDRAPIIFGGDETMTRSELLPGFQLSISSLFRQDN